MEGAQVFARERAQIERPSRRSGRRSRPTASCASRNGTPSRTSASARSVASSIGSRRGLAHARRVHAQRGDRARHHLERVAQRARGVEDRLLVLLEVAVVGERQALHDGEQRDQVADRAAGLAAHQLGDVGVLLLRHQARAGRVGVGELDEAELGGRPEHELLGEPRQVHLRDRAVARGTRARRRATRPRRGCCAAGRAKPSARAVASRSIGSVVPASAPAPSGDAREPRAQIAEAAARRGRASRRRRASGARAAPAGRAADACSRAAACRGARARARRARCAARADPRARARAASRR